MFYSLVVVTCLSAPLCFYEHSNHYGLLLHSQSECSAAAQMIAFARASAAGSESYEYRYRCSTTTDEGSWVEAKVGKGSASGITLAN
jgi:hypothetical protein